MKHKKIHALLLTALLIPLPVLAQIHYWIDSNGVKHYSSSPPESKQGIRDYQVVETLEDLSNEEPSDTSSLNSKDSAAPQRKAYPTVVMYSTSWCKYCKAARTWLQQTKVPFQDYDVEKDTSRMREFKNLGGTGYPFIVVGNNKMQGWDESTMKQFLGMAD